MTTQPKFIAQDGAATGEHLEFNGTNFAPAALTTSHPKGVEFADVANDGTAQVSCRAVTAVRAYVDGSTSNIPFTTEGNYTQEDATNGTDFAGGKVTLHGARVHTYDTGAPGAENYQTGDRSASITISTNISAAAGSVGDLIDGSFSNEYRWNAESKVGKYVKFDFGAGNEKALTKFKWYQNVSSGQGGWNFEGSNNDSDWTFVSGLYLGTPATTEDTWTNTTAYRYWRMYGTEGFTSPSAYLHQVEFAEFQMSVTASSGLFSGGSPTGLINGSTTDQTQYFAGGQTSGWIKVTLAKARIVSAFKWYQDNAASHGTWKLQGSNNDADWTDVGASFTLGGAATTEYTEPEDNATAYKYYRLLMVSGSTSATPYLYEIQFAYNSPLVYPSGTYETGNRTATITGSTNLTLSTGAISHMLNGSQANEMYWSTQSASGKYIKFDFGSGNTKTIVGFKFYQSNSTEHGTWQLQGSNNDSTWDNLGSTFTLGGGATTEYTASNSTGYRYYRLNGSAGTASSSPWIREIEFLVAKAYYVTTTNATQIDLSTATSFTATVTETLNSQSTLWIASFDGRTTWKRWNGSSWVTTTLADILDGSSASTFETGLAAWTSALGTTLDIAVGLLSDGTDTPEVDNLSIIVADSDPTALRPAIDYTLTRQVTLPTSLGEVPAGTWTVTNKTGSTKHLQVEVVD